MHRHTANTPFDPSQFVEIKQRMLNWSSRFSISLFLDSNGYTDKYGQYECLLGAGALHMLAADDADAFQALHNFHTTHPDWLFGHLSYDLKNVLEPHLHSLHDKRHGYRPLQFFVPEIVCFIRRGECVLNIEAIDTDPFLIIDDILSTPISLSAALPTLHFTSRLFKEDYLSKIDALKEHIRNGDCYEITYCNEAYATDIDFNPRTAFKSLNQLSPAPFAAFYQDGDRSLICASPERFMMKENDTVRSQPIKGTIHRGRNTLEDEELKTALLASEKERAENIMITDLVRNDLARTCEAGSIKVDELFGIYTFPQVHQMISTISGRLRNDLHFTEAIKAAFPMGSMTGAPKHKVMQLIEQYEVSRRELFSGSVGYITPHGDFDFNVIIRSLFYNASTHYLSYHTGGAITWGSQSESEWEEMRLKATSLERIFAGA